MSTLTQREKEKIVFEAVKDFQAIGGAKMDYLLDYLEGKSISEEFVREALEKGMRKGTYYLKNGLIKVNKALGGKKGVLSTN